MDVIDRGGGAAVKGWRLALGSLALSAALGLALWRAANPAYRRYAGRVEPLAITPELTGETEYCLTCHAGIEEISAAHPQDVFGCVICHGGERLALEEARAHDGLIGGRNPSDYAVVEQTCGGSDCHSGDPEDDRDHIARSLTSVQATYAGAIAAVRRAFGEQPDDAARFAIHTVDDLDGTSATGILSLEPLEASLEGAPAPVQAFAENCLTCHLSADPPAGPGYQRLTGCAACHSPSNLTGTYEGRDATIPRGEPGHAREHSLTISIPYTQCNACHNRGNYSLVDMSFHPRTDLPEGRRAPRIIDYYQPIAQFVVCEWELDCVDCHTSQEVMGDGDLHSNQAEIQYVQCKTCHGTLVEDPLTYQISDPDDVALRRAFLNDTIDLQVGDTVLMTEKGEALWNTRVTDDGYSLVGKVTGIPYEIPMVKGSACQQNLEEQESRYCHACHAVERPQ